MNNEGQFRYSVRKNGVEIDGRATDDPFVVTTITNRLSRWDGLKTFLLGGGEDVFVVWVSGTPAAHRVVFGSEYHDPGVDHRSVMQGERHDPADCRAALLETLERQKRDVRRTEANLREVGHTPAPTAAYLLAETAVALDRALGKHHLEAERLGVDWGAPCPVCGVVLEDPNQVGA